MGMHDAKFAFSEGQVSDNAGANTDVISTNVYDAGAAKKLFEGSPSDFKVAVTVTRLAGTTPDFKVRLVGADDAALTTNPEVLAEGRIAAGTATPCRLLLVPSLQKADKRFYGLMYTQTGADNDFTASAYGALDAMTIRK